MKNKKKSEKNVHVRLEATYNQNVNDVLPIGSEIVNAIDGQKTDGTLYFDTIRSIKHTTSAENMENVILFQQFVGTYSPEDATVKI